MTKKKEKEKDSLPESFDPIKDVKGPDVLYNIIPDFKEKKRNKKED